ncbi:MAG: sorbosone dehydrogenase family protein [Bradymonadaceae bacterium]
MLDRVLRTVPLFVFAAACVTCLGHCKSSVQDQPVDATTSPPDDVDRMQPDGASEVGPPLEMTETPDADRCGAPASATLEHAAVPKGHCAWVFADETPGARGIAVDSEGHVIVVTRGNGELVSLHDDDGNRVIGEGERTVLLGNTPGLNHGLRLHGGYLYASSATTVYRWPYSAGQESTLTDREVVVKGIPGGGHATRTLAAKENSDWMYVNVGSVGNTRAGEGRSTIRRYDLSSIPDGGYPWKEGGVQASGLRNEVAVEFDPQGRLWGMQNGMDNLYREDLGGDIHPDNPGEELNFLDNKGEFHGYPYCWSEFRLPDEYAKGAGTQWATPQYMDDGTHTDAWCRDESNVRPPELVVQGHSAPLGLIFYQADELDSALKGDIVAALHGSWNRPVPTGYKVIRIPMTGGGEPVRVDPLLEFAGEGDTHDTKWPHRPVEPAVAADGTLLVTSDASDVVMAVGAEE